MSLVLIGIQARSGSSRLPRKAFELIGGRMMLDRVIEAAQKASHRLTKIGVRSQVAVLTPAGDPIVQEFSPRVDIVEGDEFDVLSRYGLALDRYGPDLLVRLTGDCPFVQVNTIFFLASLAVNNGYDYLSNTDERFRTALDGADCEVVSSRLARHALECASEAYDREHVTTFIRRQPPEWAKMATAINHFDLSHIKLSVDTPEDLERARKVFDSTFAKHQEAIKIYGKGNVHRL